MNNSQGAAEDNIRALLNSVLRGGRHVDWQDVAHAHQTLLMKLCYYDPGDDSIFEILDNVFSLNPDVNLRDHYDRTAFAHACISQNYSMVDALLFLDSTLIDTVDKEECTPLIYAIKADDEHLVDKILSHPKARTSRLLFTRTKGKTPVDLAASLGNPAIMDVLNSFRRYTSMTDTKDCEKAFRRRSALPEVRSPCKGPPHCSPPSRAFITAKSHSDPLLLTRVRQRKSLAPEVEMSLGSLSRRQLSHHSGSHDRVNDQGVIHCTDRLSPPPDSALSQRRGSLSLPDLSLIPRVILDPGSDSEESEAESCRDNSHEERCDTSDDSDAEQDLTEEEDLLRMSAANARRNSISLPDLCLQTLIPQKHKTPESKFSSHGSNSHTDLPSLTKQNERRLQPGNRISDLRLPAITMCNSPSLPTLDRKSLQTQGLQKHNSAQNLNLSVRRPIAGDADSLHRLLGRRKDDVVLQSIT